MRPRNLKPALSSGVVPCDNHPNSGPDSQRLLGHGLARWSNLRVWFAQRSLTYAARRFFRLLARYGVTRTKAADRVFRCVTMLARYGCRPTFPVPGRVVRGSPNFFRRLQEAGAELTVHGYDHVDFRNLTLDEARNQLDRARNAFAAAGITAAGVRFPYLSATRELVQSLSRKEFQYSSNDAVWWGNFESTEYGDSTFRTLEKFYKPADATTAPSLPRRIGEVLELPIALPDDLQLFDGLGLRGEELVREWMHVVQDVHERGELCVLMFHPELSHELGAAFAQILERLNALHPPIWIARLGEVASWWSEKEDFSLQCARNGEHVSLRFECSERATILVRDRNSHSSSDRLVPGYRVVEGRELRLKTRQLPFIGCGAGVSEDTITSLKNDGFIVSSGDDATTCSVVIDMATASKLSLRELLDWIDSQPGTLVRIWRWPNGARSAFCMTGDLDALSLKDYATRLFN